MPATNGLRALLDASPVMRTAAVRAVLGPYLSDIELIESLRQTIPEPARRPFVELVSALRAAGW